MEVLVHSDIEFAIRELKAVIAKDGVFKRLRFRENFIKPSEQRKERKRIALKRFQKNQRILAEKEERFRERSLR